MHVRVRIFGKPDTIVVVESKLTKIDQFRRIIRDKFDIEPKLQRLFYGGKLLENGYTFHDYNIKLNDVIQLMVIIQTGESSTIEKKEVDGNPFKKHESKEKADNPVEYKDAVSTLYTIGDFVDMKDREHGAWFEGKITRIVYDPSQADADNVSEHNGMSFDKENDPENTPPTEMSSTGRKSENKSIMKYFNRSPKGKKKIVEKVKNKDKHCDDKKLLYKVQLDDGGEDSDVYCKLKEIRPRARTVIEIKDLKVGQTVMINHNVDNPAEKGHWYDFKISEIKKLRTTYKLIGTLYLGPDSVPQNDTQVKVIDKIFKIEDVIALEKRTQKYKELMATEPNKRSSPLTCLACRDDEEALCKDCGCCVCLGKEDPQKIVLCDECNYGYHMQCLKPPLTELSEDDWYCPSCKRDPNDVVAPGAAKQTKKSTNSKSNRDWGRGMACVGKTKTCAMPRNHFGPIPGIDVGMCWRFRIQLSESGVHRPPVSGIHGRDVEGAYSIVLSGGYEDDVDNGNEFTYTGSGGRDLSGNKRTAEQSCDQTLTRENKALARNCAVSKISEEGGDAGDNWRDGKPVRVVRSYKMLKHFPKYAPKEGIRYDGIYKVVKYYPEKGLSGYIVWKYLLRRDDPNPAPWEPGAKSYPIIYPDGYLEAEAEKKALKEKKGKTPKNSKKRALRESNQTTRESDEEASPPPKKRKAMGIEKYGCKASPKAKKSNIMNGSPKRKSPRKSGKSSYGLLSVEEKENICADTANTKLWDECLAIGYNNGKKEFVEYVTQVYLCIICQEVVASPVTTPCLHNFCLACIKLAFKSTGNRKCPYCRNNLADYELEVNDALKTALRSILTGYDVGRN